MVSPEDCFLRDQLGLHMGGNNEVVVWLNCYCVLKCSEVKADVFTEERCYEPEF